MEKKIYPSDPETRQLYGTRLAISGDTLAVGATGFNSPPGKVYVYERSLGGPDAWGEAQVLSDGDPSNDPYGDNFGKAVAVRGDTIVATLPYSDANGASALGRAFMYQRNAGNPHQWDLAKVISPTSTSTSVQAGDSMAFTGDTLFLGAPSEIESPPAPPDFTFIVLGKVYVFERDEGGANTWGQTAVIAPADNALEDHFGKSIAADFINHPDWVFIGSPDDDDQSEQDSGSVYLFERTPSGSNTWIQIDKLHASDGKADDSFGRWIDFQGDTLVVGAPNDDGQLENSGAVYIYVPDPGGGFAETKITAADGQAGDYFGANGRLSGDTLAVGAWGDNPSGGEAVYLFRRNEGGPGAWGQVAKITASDGSSEDDFGTGVDMDGDRLVVGANFDEDLFEYGGSVYIYDLFDVGGACAGCTTGFCVDGVCCESNCDGPCEACVGSQTGAEDGLCRLIISGTDPGGECDDLNPCTDDTCESGACSNIYNTAPCDDGDLCTESDTCVAGACAGSPRDCSALDGPCAVGACEASTGGCVAQPANEGDPCDDGDYCTLTDLCNDGSCVPGAARDCSALDGPCNTGVCDSAQQQCLSQPAHENDSCDDALYCTIDDICTAGTCSGAPRNCTVGESCRVGFCDEDANQCVGDPVADGSPCVDSDPCTWDDACTSGNCVGTSYTCSDTDVCTDDSCNGDGTCTYTPNTATCDDGDPCTRDDTCQGGTCAGTAYSCDDDNICTDDSCEGDGICAHVPNTATCDDEDPCTPDDTCQGGTCVGGPTTCIDAGPQPQEAGVKDLGVSEDRGATPDRGVSSPDAGNQEIEEEPDDGCSCALSKESSIASGWWIGLLLMLSLIRKFRVRPS